MQIRPTNSIQTTQALNLQTRNSIGQTSQMLPSDQLEISAEAQNLASLGEVRSDRIAEIRTQIAQGQYESPEKLEIALNRMFDQIV